MLNGLPDNSLVLQNHLFLSAAPPTGQVALPIEPLLDLVGLFHAWRGLCSVHSPASGAGHAEGRPQLWASVVACHTSSAGYAKAAVSTRDSSQQLLKSHCKVVHTHRLPLPNCLHTLPCSLSVH